MKPPARPLNLGEGAALPMMRSCDVDGCGEAVIIRSDGDGWRVQHGRNPEHQRPYSTTELFVTTGYRPWARAVHEYGKALLDG